MPAPDPQAAQTPTVVPPIYKIFVVYNYSNKDGTSEMGRNVLEGLVDIRTYD